MTLKTLDANYKCFFVLRKKGHVDAQPPSSKGKKWFTTMVYNQSGFMIEKGKMVCKRVLGINERNTTKECHTCGELQDMPLWERR